MNKNDLGNNLYNSQAVNQAPFADFSDSGELGVQKADEGVHDGLNEGLIDTVVIAPALHPSDWDDDQNQLIGSLTSMFFGTSLVELR
ncbi:MAG: hypothetical protein Q8T09_08180 [Candidatus Melainabacteria bacterium]|nr:hypothetical protein [Candidatus Melainabacteria bacterium]